MLIEYYKNMCHVSMLFAKNVNSFELSLSQTVFTTLLHVTPKYTVSSLVWGA